MHGGATEEAFMSPFPVRPGTQFFALTASPKPIAGPAQADGRPIGYCNGFICDADGTVAIVGKDSPDVTPITIPVLKGFPYQFSIKLITAITGPSNVTGWL